MNIGQFLIFYALTLIIVNFWIRIIISILEMAVSKEEKDRKRYNSTYNWRLCTNSLPICKQNRSSNNRFEFMLHKKKYVSSFFLLLRMHISFRLLNHGMVLMNVKESLCRFRRGIANFYLSLTDCQYLSHEILIVRLKVCMESFYLCVAVLKRRVKPCVFPCIFGTKINMLSGCYCMNRFECFSVQRSKQLCCIQPFYSIQRHISVHSPASGKSKILTTFR